MRRTAKIAVLALILLTLAGARAGAQDNPQEVIKKSSPAVVQLIISDLEGKTWKYGSAFFVSSDGRLVTYRRLLLGAQQAVAKTPDGKEYPLKKILAEDKDGDLILAAVDLAGATVPHLTVIGTLPQMGERVLVLGATRKLDHTLGDGIVSGFREFLSMGRVIQITAMIPPTVMGGPVLNLKGEVVGVAGTGKADGHDFHYALPGAKVLALQPNLNQPLADWVSAHSQEALEYYYKRADAAFTAKRTDDGFLALRNAIRVQPTNPQVWFKLGQALLKFDKPQEAAEILRQAVKLKADYAEAHYHLGLACLKLNQPEAAQKQVEVLARLDQKLAQKLKDGFKPATPAGAELSLPEVIEKIQPTVVFISGYSSKGKLLGTGSGFFINAEGHLVTNYHVLRGKDKAEIRTKDGKKFPITRVLAEDKDGDLILVAVDLGGGIIPFLQVAKELPRMGERLVIVGNPKGFEQTATDGIISAIRELPQLRRGKVIQITAPISHGSSGSPVVNMKGEVVGIVSLFFPSGQNLNFAVSAQGVAGLKPGPGQTLEERSAQWLKEAQDLVKEGRGHLDGKDYAKAVKTLQLAAKTKPDLAEARYYLGLAYLKLGQQEDATKELTRLKGLDAKLATDLQAALQTAAKGPTEMLPEIIRRIKPAVVKVITYDAKGKRTGFGSGFFVTKEGHFVTNHHVMEGFHRAEVKTAKGDLYPVAKVLAEDKKGDLALATTQLPEGATVPFLTVTDLLPEVGERIIAVGNPEGFELTSSDGIVSALRNFENVGTVIQMTAAISPGSSGGPVANLKGQVIGVSTFFWTEGQNLNFAVPGKRVRSLFKH